MKFRIDKFIAWLLHLSAWTLCSVRSMNKHYSFDQNWSRLNHSGYVHEANIQQLNAIQIIQCVPNTFFSTLNRIRYEFDTCSRYPMKFETFFYRKSFIGFVFHFTAINSPKKKVVKFSKKKKQKTIKLDFRTVSRIFKC